MLVAERIRPGAAFGVATCRFGGSFRGDFLRVKLPPPSPNPRYREFRECLAAHPDWLGPWTGCFFRFQTLQFPSAADILSGEGASRRGGRWNPPGLRAIYGSTTDSAALEEAKANDRYYGVVTRTPRLVVTINASAPQMLDLT